MEKRVLLDGGIVMKGKIVKKEVIYSIELKESELYKIIEMITFYKGYYPDDREAKPILGFLLSLKEDNNYKNENKYEDDEEFFYDTYNARVENSQEFFLDKENIRFIYGKNGQIGIQYWYIWDDSAINNPESNIWINKPSSIVIADFIKKRGKGLIGANKFTVSRSSDTRTCLTLRFYLDNKGNISVNKNIIIEIDTFTEMLTIRKDDQKISMNIKQADKLADFINFHNGNEER